MKDAILVLNAGSSSVKFSLFHPNELNGTSDMLCEGQLSDIGENAHFAAADREGSTLVNRASPKARSHETALDALLSWISKNYVQHGLIAAGHRVVHGGARYTEPVLIDSNVIDELRHLIPLAPLHQPHHIAAIEAMQRLHPGLPQVACFDTSFHHEQKAVVTNFALPRVLTEEGIRRYGFHGLSYEYIASVMPGVIGEALAGARVVVAHLGSGASMCALLDKKSVATTMGFTALDGLPMSRRCGNLDPGVVLYLMQEKGMSASAVSNLLYNDSGLYGVSGISDDMRALLNSDDPHAAEAIDMFVYRINRELGSLAAALGGIDVLVFTAGIGEHAPEIRRRVCDAAAWLGVVLDNRENTAGGPRLSHPDSKVSAWVIPTNEDLMIARHTQEVLTLRRTQEKKSEERTGAGSFTNTEQLMKDSTQ